MSIGNVLRLSLLVGSVLLLGANAIAETILYHPVFFRVHNNTKDATITEVGIRFTNDKGLVSNDPITNVRIGPGSEQEFKSQDGPCFLKIEGVIKFTDNKGVLRPPMMKTISEPKCIVGVRDMYLSSKKP